MQAAEGDDIRAHDDEGHADDDAPIPPPPPDEFVNTGLRRWEEIRHRWLSSSSSSSGVKSNTAPAAAAAVAGGGGGRLRHAKDVDIDEVIDLIVSNRWRQQQPPPPSSAAYAPSSSRNSSAPADDAAGGTTTRTMRGRDDACFPSPVSLPQMVDVLVDLWEAEGLDI
ncbi:hypothetical protein ACHAW5_002988 [Stephanodiscus triporus]|uniref:DUF4050 domain-containing protein n=1 Tax=Stephanodiscus triporus TaxID=2934178 RepID=A0ABD3NCI4_9STRA